MPPPSVDDSRTTYELTVAEVEALRGYVSEQARGDERGAAERLLGQLAALSQHHAGHGRAQRLRFAPVPAAAELAARAVDALRNEGDVWLDGRRWRVQAPRPSSASNSRLAPGSSPGDGAA